MRRRRIYLRIVGDTVAPKPGVVGITVMQGSTVVFRSSGIASALVARSIKRHGSIKLALNWSGRPNQSGIKTLTPGNVHRPGRGRRLLGHSDDPHCRSWLALERKRRESPLSPSCPEHTSGLGNNPQQLAEANWLGQVLIDADLPGAPPVFLAGIARDDDDPRSGERFVCSHL